MKESGICLIRKYIESLGRLRFKMTIEDFIEPFDNLFIHFVACNKLAFVEA